jgi:glycosyltransferase involved in cell wall biosynthesis
LCTLHATRSHFDSLPTKIFEYYAAGIPVIASDFPRWRPLVEGCGLLIDPNDSVALAQAITYLDNHPEEAREMGERGRDRVMRELNWSSESSRLFSFYETLR